MLIATPGRGRITRLTLSDQAPAYGEHAAVPARLVPHPNRPPEHWIDNPVRAVTSVDIVVPHPSVPYATGAVITFRDAEAARGFARAAYRAAALLGQLVPPDYLTEETTPEAETIASLP